MVKPDFYYESSSNSNDVVGVDEVGRGALSGPIVAATVKYDLRYKHMILQEPLIQEIRDSKVLSEKKRCVINGFIMSYDKLIYHIEVKDNKYIDEFGIAKANKEVMLAAIKNLSAKVSYILIDGQQNLDIDIPQTNIIKGDQKSLSIATASIVAKVFRDNIMNQLSELYPVYNWYKNKGYGTKEHVQAIKQYSYSPFHRTSFQPIKNLVINS